MEEALRRYQLSEEEFLSWQRAFETHGLAGLRATRVQQYRGSRPPRGPDHDADSIGFRQGTATSARNGKPQW
jgi:hypothetical protein